MYNTITARNIGIFTQEEQSFLHSCSVGIAGVGGIGGLLAERLMRIGIGKIKITDPGTFEFSNLNRQYGSSIENIGKNKVEIIAALLKSINPKCTVLYDNLGISDQKSADIFVEDIAIVVDEMDYGLFDKNIYLNRSARKNGIFYMFSTALGFGGLVSIFSPKGISLETYNDFPSVDISPDSPRIKILSNKLFPHFPSYMKGKEELVKKMIEGTIEISTNSIGVGLAAIITANEVVNLLLNKTQLIEAPQFIYIDLMDKVYRTE
jgi:molybdopterin/thiamine biosynthesis adenylyltransferase